MARLLVHVEGKTEEDFVIETLAPHLLAHGFRTVSARLIGNALSRDRRGGICAWGAARKDILNQLKADAGITVTTMVDFYALPQSGTAAWPGRAEAGKVSFERKAALVEDALAADIVQEMGRNFVATRFVPYVMMHEFEAMLFSDCQRFAQGIERSALAPQFQAIRDQFANPEEINDSPETAPSKRVKEIVSNYQKPLFGNLAVVEIGLEKIRAECPHFRHWLEKLENVLE